MENTNPVPVVVGIEGKVAPGGSVIYGNEVGGVFFILKQNPLQCLMGRLNKTTETNSLTQSQYIADASILSDLCD